MAVHKVRAGETLSVIAHRFGVSWQAVARLNALANANQLVAGQVLKLPPRVPGHLTHGPTSPHSIGPIPPGVEPVPGETPPSGDIAEVQLRAVMPNAVAQAPTFLGPLNTAMRACSIDTNEKKAAFLAQISVESGDLRNTQENLNYSAQRLHQVWPKRFPTIESAQPYAQNPEALGNHVYANRLGNGDEASGDGYRFRGRGLMQTTGRDNYVAVGYENNPDDLANPTTAANSAALFWSSNGLNPRSAAVLTRGAFDGITLTVNGGTQGSDERWNAYGRAVAAFGLEAAR